MSASSSNKSTLNRRKSKRRNPPLMQPSRMDGDHKKLIDKRLKDKRESLTSAIKHLPRQSRRKNETHDFGSYKPQALSIRDIQSLGSEADFLFKVIEGSFVLYKTSVNVVKLHKEQSLCISELSYAAIIFNNIFSGKSMTMGLVKGASSTQSRLLSYLNEIFESTTPQDGFEELIYTARDYMTTYSNFKHTKLYLKLYRFFMYSLSFSLFDRLGINFDLFGYRKVEKEAVRRKFYSRQDFVEVAADSFLFLIETGYQIMKTRSIEPLFHSSSSYTKWFDEYSAIMRQAIYVDTPAVFDEVFGEAFSEHKFLKNLKDCIDKGESIYKFSHSLGDFERNRMRTMVDKLHMLQCNQLTTQKACENRDVPLSLLISGCSKFGKSDIKDMLRLHWCSVKGEEKSPSCCYTVTAESKHWNNFETFQHTLIMDDIAFLKPNAAPNGDPSIINLLQIVNGVPFMPEQAAIEKKGKTPLRVKLVIGTTNTEHLNAHYYFSCPSAVQRRFPYIIVPHVKEEFQDDEGFLCSEKVVNIPNTYPDWWYWTVKVVSPSKDPKLVSKPKVILDKVDQKTFLQWYTSAIRKHDEIQDSMKVTLRNMEATPICNVCCLPQNLCDCSIQNGDVNDTVPMDFLYYFGQQHFSNTLMAGFCTYFSTFIYSSFLYTMFTFCGIFLLVPIWFNNTWFTSLYEHIFYKIVVRLIMWKIENHRMTRWWFGLMGRRVRYSNINTPRILGTLSGVLVSGYVLLKLRRFFSSEPIPQGGSISKGVKPKAAEAERPNVWYNEKPDLTHSDFSSVSKSFKSLAPQKVLNRLADNCVHFRFKITDTHYKITKGFCLTNNYYLLNNHSLPKQASISCEMVLQDGTCGITRNVHFLLEDRYVARDPLHDACVIYVPHLPPKKSILELFPQNDLEPNLRGHFLKRNGTGEMFTAPISNITFAANVTFALDDHETMDSYCAESSFETFDGDCGSMYMASTPYGPVILGFHILMAQDKKVAVACKRGWIINLMRQFDELKVQSGSILLSSSSAEHELGPLSQKSVFRFIEEGNAEIYGSFKKRKFTQESKVCRTPMYPYLKAKGLKENYTVPQMHGFTPWRIAALASVKPALKFSPTLVDKVRKAYLRDILVSLNGDLKELEVYDNFTALNGAAGVSYVDKLARGTSAGWPWCTSKRKFLYEVPPVGENLDPVDATSEIWERVRRIEEQYAQHELVHPIFTAHLKDEAVSFKKAEMGKTRVFTGAPMDWTLVVRKYLLSTCRLVQCNRFAFEAMPGTIAQSFEWGEIYRHLTKFGDTRMIAGDYKSFDKQMPAILIRAAFDIIYDLCKLSGNYTETDLAIVKCIGLDTAYPTVNFNGDLVKFYGSNPSGHPLTVIINSLVNSMYMRYVYHELNPSKEVDSFKANVALITYGDDNAMGVSDRIPWFNHTTISEELAKLDIVYTMADKEAASIPYVPMKDVSFLKRTWVYDEDVGDYLAPLAFDSIEKSLMTWVRSKKVWSGDQAIDVISSACREFFFYGRESFLRWRTSLFQMCSEVACTECDPYLGTHKLSKHITDATFPSWDLLLKQFHSYKRE